MAKKKTLTHTQKVFGDQYDGWVASERDIRFDKVWNLILTIAFIVPTVLGALLIWHII